MTFPAHIIHAPQASRTGGRRTLRYNMEPWTSRGERRALGRPGRSLKIFVEATHRGDHGDAAACSRRVL